MNSGGLERSVEEYLKKRFKSRRRKWNIHGALWYFGNLTRFEPTAELGNKAISIRLETENKHSGYLTIPTGEQRGEYVVSVLKDSEYIVFEVYPEKTDIFVYALRNSEVDIERTERNAPREDFKFTIKGDYKRHRLIIDERLRKFVSSRSKSIELLLPSFVKH